MMRDELRRAFGSSDEVKFPPAMPAKSEEKMDFKLPNAEKPEKYKSPDNIVDALAQEMGMDRERIDKVILEKAKDISKIVMKEDLSKSLSIKLISQLKNFSAEEKIIIAYILGGWLGG